ncbi:MAG: DUF4169 family protein [Rhodopseudomonas sp.]|nr:DUF4169 family protein [Rhodopseudomonas sp.]
MVARIHHIVTSANLRKARQTRRRRYRHLFVRIGGDKRDPNSGVRKPCIRLPTRQILADLVNLRTARKQAKRRQDDEHAKSQRLAHGQPKSLRQRELALRDKAKKDLDGHLIEPGDGR